MFRFTIRELLLVTLVVAMGIAWGLRENQLRAEAERALQWRSRAAALEHVLVSLGWRVRWPALRVDGGQDMVHVKSDRAAMSGNMASYEPTADY